MTDDPRLRSFAAVIDILRQRTPPRKNPTTTKQPSQHQATTKTTSRIRNQSARRKPSPGISPTATSGGTTRTGRRGAGRGQTARAVLTPLKSQRSPPILLNAVPQRRGELEVLAVPPRRAVAVKPAEARSTAEANIGWLAANAGGELP